MAEKPKSVARGIVQQPGTKPTRDRRKTTFVPVESPSSIQLFMLELLLDLMEEYRGFQGFFAQT